MKSNIKLTFVGGGSYQWAPRIIKDILLKEGLQSIDFCLLDKSVDSANEIRQLGEKMNRDLKTTHTFRVTDEDEEAFDGCDFVIICISTGGLATMKHDLAIPEKYGIYQVVGDTVGPGGWSRNMRNIPVFNDLADKIQQGSPDAVVINYTNPMACLTKAFYARTKLRAVGLCHGLFENYSVMQDIFGLEKEEQLKTRFGGVNHFFWLLDFKVDGQDGYSLLKEKLKNNKIIVDLINDAHKDEAGFQSTKYLTSELFQTFGYLPYVGDRHTCEFLPHILNDEDQLKGYQIHRTTIEERQDVLSKNKQGVQKMLTGEENITYEKSRESAADIVEAMTLGKEFIDVINVPNTGQIPNLPLGGIVETLGVVNSIGFTPLTAGPLPDSLLHLVRPHLENSEIIYKAATEGDWELALQGLYQDPVCSRLDYRDIRRMAEELLKANREYLPQFN